jgi:hypothetical protein
LGGGSFFPFFPLLFGRAGSGSGSGAGAFGLAGFGGSRIWRMAWLAVSQTKRQPPAYAT